MSVKEEGQELLVCCICLATDTTLYNIQESNLLKVFVDLMGTEEFCSVGRCVCSVCRAQLARAAALRARGRRAQALLASALQRTQYITLDYIRTIDRVAEKLCLNLKTSHVYTSDSTLPDVKEEIKEETDFTENIFVAEPTLADYDDFRESTPEFENDDIEEITTQGSTELHSNNKIEPRINKRKLSDNKRILKSTKGKKKLPKRSKTTQRLESTKDLNLPESTIEKLPEKTKRVIKRRMADNGFLPDFNFEEFEIKYNCKIDILSKEEQMREIEARKMAPSYTLAAFGCEVCGKSFATQQVYEGHMLKHDPSAGGHACGVCGVRFGTRSRAHVHADAHRLRFTCGACGFLTRTRFIAKNHFLTHSGTTHPCPHCDATFTKYTSYLTHVRRRHPAMNVACDECGETFVGRNGLRHHKTRVHRHTQPKPRASNVPCSLCSQTFVCAASLATHHERVHLNIRVKEPPRARARNARAFICELCGAECSSVSSLSAHQRVHAGARPHQCPAAGCARRFATLHNMQRHHRVVHLGRRPQVACGVCGKLLAHAASLKLHVNTVHLKLPAPRRRDKDARQQ
ncbi:GDNF-inducible zinc finger protein 1-like [Cydia pomonella]|uniref:GDNF-inducible zinc finger protein 1-like n=1 Tax=Cydia pomonella TaxID=82600 RepID=UPI002ADE7AD2|nr:GDNF-inducible zinc finger protein 1-like [Cydia pomonella]